MPERSGYPGGGRGCEFDRANRMALARELGLNRWDVDVMSPYELVVAAAAILDGDAQIMAAGEAPDAHC